MAVRDQTVQVCYVTGDKITALAGSAQAEAPLARLAGRAARALLAALALVPTAAAPLMAQYPRARPGEFEVRGFDIAPGGGWRQATATVIAERQAALRGGALSRLNSPLLTIRGTFHLPVIPLSFTDAPLPFARQTYHRLFFDPTPDDRAYSVRSYYTAASRGNVVLDGWVFDPVRLPGSAAYYQDGCNGIGVYAACPVRATSRITELLLAALDSVSRGAGGDTVWNRFDNDGRDGRPNSGDDDGVVDLVTFLQPRVDGACGTAGIWAHRYVIRGWNDGVSYATRTPRRNADGHAIPGQFLRVDSYTMQSGRGGNSSCAGDEVMAIGTVAHETGHAFGLPDLYDTDRLAGGEGIGEWGLMSSGNYAAPWSPSSFDAWSLVQLGWVAVDTVATGRMVSAGAVQQTDTVYHVPTDRPGVSLLIENRQAVGSDTAMMNPAFRRPKGPGLLIWRIDDARIAATLSSNSVNVGSRPGVALMQADGLDHMAAAAGGTRNRGDAGDPWPGASQRVSFGLSSTPVATDWNRIPLGVRIDRITLSAGRVAFRMTRGAVTLITARALQARVTVDGTARSSWSEIVPVGDTVRVRVDSLQLLAGQRTRASFVRWNDGGPRNRDIVATGRPDTLHADFLVTHRLDVHASDGGVVTSSIPGSIGAGTFVSAGTTARLDATPSPGMEFVRWKGDTVSTARGIVVTLNRPWSLTAEFVRPVTVDAVVASRAVLGGAPLDPLAVAYLDATGNRNGAYDVGDLLAWLHRTRQPLPPALMRLRPGRAP